MAKVEIPDLPDNSYTARVKKKVEEEKKPLDKVVQGKIVHKKKSIHRRFMERFVGEDAPDLKEYMVEEVLVPGVKNILGNIVDGIGNGFMDLLNLAIFGSVQRGGRISNRPYTSYGSYYSGGRSSRRDPRPAVNRVRPKKMFDDLIFETRADADRVIQSLFDVLERYGRVSVADLNQLIGVTGQWSDNNWGWDSLENADIKRDRDGYFLILPDVISLKE